ncbi:hypothetical protein NDU88_005606 [Pleurodeles waltl]|uniref:Uncharacterized protein n=1 Tax=Pleurodeles waltl TaxID=8319 RepID=A0AAV7LLP2_PLEWA|nr:hypothetical protein NDU88_005606 [Pleurodeles waltl]
MGWSWESCGGGAGRFPLPRIECPGQEQSAPAEGGGPAGEPDCSEALRETAGAVLIPAAAGVQGSDGVLQAEEGPVVVPFRRASMYGEEFWLPDLACVWILAKSMGEEEERISHYAEQSNEKEITDFQIVKAITEFV